MKKILKKLIKKLPANLKWQMKWMVKSLSISQIFLLISAVKKEFFSKGLSEHELFFDNTTICTANCIFCAYQFDIRKKEIATLDHFKKSINEFRELGGKKLDLTPLTGELFVSNSIIEQIKYAKEIGIREITFFTNATLFHKVDLKDLLSAGVDRISISVTPLRSDLYKLIYRTDSYKRVLSNIRDLLKIAKLIKSKTHIALNYRGNMSVNECNRLEDFLNYCKPYVTENVTFHSMTYFDTWAGRIESSDLLPGMNLVKVKNKAPLAPCHRLWNIHIEPSGDVNLCGCRTNYSYEKESPLKIGNLNKLPLKEIVNSKKAIELKKSFLKGKLNDICANCTWYGI